MNIDTIIGLVGPASKKYFELARKRTAELAMPRRAMGRVNDLSERLCAISGSLTPKVDRRGLFIMAADHGVCAEGVSAYPQELTMMMLNTMLAGKSTVTTYARITGTDIILTDMGALGTVIPPQECGCTFFDRKIARGTGNIAVGPAMSQKDAEQSVITGFEIADMIIKERGLNLITAGEMGIGNTTPSTAIASVFTGIKPELITGRGTGIDDDGVKRKIRAINDSISLHRPDPSDPIGVLSSAGGFEIGAIAGVMLAAAANSIPVVLDGLIATAGAMIAASLAPHCKDYMIAGHLSAELGHKPMLDKLQLEPLLNLGMCLGEGTGAICAFGVIELAAATISEVALMKDLNI